MRAINSNIRPRHNDDHHEELRSLLPVYATALILGHPAQTWYPSVAAHIATCSTCRAEFEELQDIVELSYSGAITPAASTPQFDLSFLQPQETPKTQQSARSEHKALSWQRDQLGRLVIMLSEYLSFGIQTQPLLRLERGASRQRWTVEPDTPEQASITIELFDDDHPDLVVVQVQVDLATITDPLSQANIVVMLRADEKVWEEVTDEAGVVRIPAVPRTALPGLRLEIELPSMQG